MSRSLPHFALVLLPLALGSVVAGALAGADDIASAPPGIKALGIKDLPALLKKVDSKDADTRLRARRLATRIVLEHYRRAAPAGMNLVHHRVTFADQSVQLPGAFYLSVAEVTRAEFTRFANAKSLPVGPWSKGALNLPVVWINFHEAAAYAKSKGARLPTIEELSRATTSFDRLAYPWGNKFDPRFLNSLDGRKGGPKPPGTFPLGRSRDGIDDLLGNVAEWTDSSTGKTQRRRIFGGSWRTLLDGKRSPFQVNRMAKTARDQDVGFRLALSLPALPAPLAPPPPATSSAGSSDPAPSK